MGVNEEYKKREPLAFRMAPRSLSEYIGQEHILGEGKMLSPDELEKQFDRMMSKDRLGHYHTYHFVVASVILGLF